MGPADPAAFEVERAHLLRVGYRITGRLADAEDAVQEAWLRYAAQDTAPDDLRAWLTTVVARLCLDRLRSSAARRERYVGPWLPEPLLTGDDPDDPLHAVVLHEDVRMAAMVVLERLSAPQRVAFVLHEALALPYAEIAAVLDCPEPTARQHAARARRIVAAAPVPPRPRTEEQQAALAAFADAMAHADVRALLAVLHPDVVLVNDGGGEVAAARRPVVGAEKVARLLLGLLVRYGPGMLQGEVALVNGDLGLVTHDPAAVTVLTVDDGRIVGLHSVLNPAKIAPRTPRRSPGR
ncbi:RNA polymerase sigma factor SigJ [Pseudonocardia broussonetiae]|uniref:RNA polymerase sigma factor SigJ n=1 Tax=Pseudonocardia broussonetiae TaxID=2736640 RepID=UPI001F04EA23|nr:RNA polymerase sigma factor SigJ [Pseudonocardia broussonetiae]